MKHIQFCPDVKGPCLGVGCAAYMDGLEISVANPAHLFQQAGLGDTVLGAGLQFSMTAGVCSRYNCFADEESCEMYKLFYQDLFGDLPEEDKNDM